MRASVLHKVIVTSRQIVVVGALADALKGENGRRAVIVPRARQATLRGRANIANTANIYLDDARPFFCCHGNWFSRRYKE